MLSGMGDSEVGHELHGNGDGLHLSNVAKYSHQSHSINLSDPDTLQHHLDTRFAQLNTSVELELWQEAFRSVEDVHNLLTMAKKAPCPAMMANYYEKLTCIFLMSSNVLYHAAVWGRYKRRLRHRPGRHALQVKSSSARSPSWWGSLPPLRSPRSSVSRPSLGSPSPARANLLKDALARDVLRRAPAPIKQLYDVLEVTFELLTLCANVAPILAQLRTSVDYAPYVPLLQHALLSRLLSQLAQVCTGVRISFVMELVAPLRTEDAEGGSEDTTDKEKPKGGSVFDPEQAESYIMGCARRGKLSVRVDHADGSITFVGDPFVDMLDESHTARDNNGNIAVTEEDSAVQPSVAELVCTRLGSVARYLHNALQVIAPSPVHDGRVLWHLPPRRSARRCS
ncbi:hypothetical protein C8R45DRAFT_1132894 [Mycena sanguinolenta]|nr:hypothetical protein C8R45DRAFT_1132894 [Mycena sanguinolenta]